jgi:hypothetical protein
VFRRASIAQKRKEALGTLGIGLVLALALAQNTLALIQVETGKTNTT